MARSATDTATVAQTQAQASTAQPKLIIPLGRGSRGKSWWTRWAVERAQAQGREVVVADADRTNPTLSSYFEGVVAPSSNAIASEMSLAGFLAQHGIRPVAVHLLGPDADDLTDHLRIGRKGDDRTPQQLAVAWRRRGLHSFDQAKDTPHTGTLAEGMTAE